MPWYKLTNNNSRSALESIAKDLESKRIFYKWCKTEGKRPRWYICVEVTYDEEGRLTPVRGGILYRMMGRSTASSSAA